MTIIYCVFLFPFDFSDGWSIFLLDLYYLSFWKKKQISSHLEYLLYREDLSVTEI